jgi:hypothetical protein
MWWLMLVFLIGDVAGILTTIWQNIHVPFWIWILIFLLGLHIAQFLAFHKVRLERDELKRQLQMQKRVPLRNRGPLIRAIGVIKEKAIALKMRQDDLNFKEKHHENPQKELVERDNAWFAYLDAKKDLETERLVAGDNFRAVIDNLMMFVDYHVDDCMNMIIVKNKPETLKTIPFMTQLDNNIEQAIRDLDALSLREPDKGDCQA